MCMVWWSTNRGTLELLVAIAMEEEEVEDIASGRLQKRDSGLKGRHDARHECFRKRGIQVTNHFVARNQCSFRLLLGNSASRMDTHLWTRRKRPSPSYKTPSPKHKIKRKPVPKLDSSERYPSPDPSDPFLPFTALRGESKTHATVQLYPTQQPKPSHYRPHSQSGTPKGVQPYSLSNANASQPLLSGLDGDDDVRSDLSAAAGSVGRSTLEADSLRLPMGFDFDRCHSISPDPLPPSPESQTAPIFPCAAPGSDSDSRGRLARLFGLKETNVVKKKSRNHLKDGSPTSNDPSPFTPPIASKDSHSRLTPVGELESDVRSLLGRGTTKAVAQSQKNEHHSRFGTPTRRPRRMSNASITSTLYLSAPSSPTRSDYETSTIASVGSTGSVTVTNHRVRPPSNPVLSPRLRRNSELGDAISIGNVGEQKKKKSRGKEKDVRVRRSEREVQSESESLSRGWRHFDLDESDLDCDSDYVSAGDMFRPRAFGKGSKLSLETSDAISHSRSRPCSHSSSPSSSSGSSSRTTSTSTSVSTSTSASSYISTPNTTPRSSASISPSHFPRSSSVSSSVLLSSSTSPNPPAIIVTPTSPVKPEYGIEESKHSPLHTSPKKSHFSHSPTTPKPTQSLPASPRSPTRVFSDSVVPTFAAFLSNENLLRDAVAPSTIHDADGKGWEAYEHREKRELERQVSSVKTSTTATAGTPNGAGIAHDSKTKDEKQEHKRSGSKFKLGVRKILRALKREKEYEDSKNVEPQAQTGTLGRTGESSPNLETFVVIDERRESSVPSPIESISSSFPPPSPHAAGTLVNDYVRKNSMSSFMSSSTSGAVDLQCRQLGNQEKPTSVVEVFMDAAADDGVKPEVGDMADVHMAEVADDGNDDVDMVVLSEDTNRRCSPYRMSTIESEGELDQLDTEEQLGTGIGVDKDEPAAVGSDQPSCSTPDDLESEARLFHYHYRQASRSRRSVSALSELQPQDELVGGVDDS